MKRFLTHLALPAIALACFLSVPGLSFARGGGGGGHGGGHGGGGHGGGHGSYGHGSYGHGGYGHGGYGGYGRGFGYGGYGLGGFGLGYGLGYGGYGYGGYGGGYGYNNYYSSPYYYSTPIYTDPYYVAPAYGSAIVGTTPSTGYQSFYPSTGVTIDSTRAYIHVQVPPSAQVLFDNTPTQQTGPDRTFVSPPLDNNHNYSYTVTAQWTQNGQEQRQTRTVQLVPGQSVDVNFVATANSQPQRLNQPQPANQSVAPNQPQQFQQSNQVAPNTPAPAINNNPVTPARTPNR